MRLMRSLIPKCVTSYGFSYPNIVSNLLCFGFLPVFESSFVRLDGLNRVLG